jgi:outer membrane lipoprotein-sorting protein
MGRWVRTLAITLGLLLASAPVGAADPPPDAMGLLRAIDKNMMFQTRTMTVTMISKNPRRTREFTMVTYGRGEDEAAIEYVAPEREKGTRMLRKGDELWLYMPSVEKTQKISGHMLRQGMMGTDVSYEDLMSAGDFETVYDAKTVGSEDCGAPYAGRPCWKVEMTAKDASVSYPKRIAWIDQEYDLAVRQELFAVSGMLLKKWTMSDIQKFDGTRWFPTRMEIADQIQQGTSTTLVFEDVKFGVTLQEEVFTTRWLERGG